MRHPVWHDYLLIWLSLGFAILFGLIFSGIAFAQNSDAQPVYNHNACTGNCVADMVFLHSGQGDTMAENSFNSWMNTYWELTGCEESEARTAISFLLDIAAEFVEAPSATIMQCWQGMGGIAATCSDTCSDYGRKNGAYAPNVHTSLLDSGQGWAQVNVDNSSNIARWDGGPDSPNGYSRDFTIYTWLQYQDGPELLVYTQDIPSLSFPNWITRRGVDNCNNSYGADDIRCQMLASFDMPSELSADPSFGNGALYNLQDLISNSSGLRGSPENGYALLATDGARVTIQQGLYTVYTYEWTHNITKGTTSNQVSQKDASSGSVTITNHESNSVYDGIFNDKVDRDTYVFILSGPDNLLVLGDYHVSIEAYLVHDKDTTDNSVAYDYTVEGPPPPPQATSTPINMGALPVEDVIPGTHSDSLTSSDQIRLYRITVPSNTRALQIHLEGSDGNYFGLFTEYIQPPVPSYPYLYDWEYDCWSPTGIGFGAYCGYLNPFPGEYYFSVILHSGSGNYTLTIDLLAGATSTPHTYGHSCWRNDHHHTNFYPGSGRTIR